MLDLPRDRKARSLLPGTNGAFLTLVADMARPMSAYAHSETLAWRDASDTRACS